MKHRQAIKALEKKAAPKGREIIFAWHEDDGTLTIKSGPIKEDVGKNFTFEEIDRRYPKHFMFYGGRDLPLMHV